MTLNLTQMSVDILNNTATIAFNESRADGKYVYLSLIVPIPAEAKLVVGGSESAARSEAVRVLKGALAQLEAHPANVFS